jgi:hypothetical protein
VIVFCSLLFVFCGCLLSWWSSFLRQDDKFGGRLERIVVLENWSRRMEVMCDCVL